MSHGYCRLSCNKVHQPKKVAVTLKWLSQTTKHERELLLGYMHQKIKGLVYMLLDILRKKGSMSSLKCSMAFRSRSLHSNSKQYG